MRIRQAPSRQSKVHMNGTIAEPWVAISSAPNNAIVEVDDVFNTS
jgi:hypothetical protein